eukprot:10429918-Alexandrium_andersonii.AAC.1
MSACASREASPAAGEASLEAHALMRRVPGREMRFVAHGNAHSLPLLLPPWSLAGARRPALAHKA